jgi:hypothetical protein
MLRRVEKLEPVLRPAPPRVIAAVAHQGLAYSPLLSDGSRQDGAAVPVADLPPGAELVEADPACELVTFSLAAGGGAAVTHVAGVYPDVIVGKRLLPPGFIPPPPARYRHLVVGGGSPHAGGAKEYQGDRPWWEGV